MIVIKWTGGRYTEEGLARLENLHKKGRKDVAHMTIPGYLN